MYYYEMTDTARRIFIASILENEENDSKALEMIKDFIISERNTDEIESEMFAEN